MVEQVLTFLDEASHDSTDVFRVLDGLDSMDEFTVFTLPEGLDSTRA